MGGIERGGGEREREEGGRREREVLSVKGLTPQGFRPSQFRVLGGLPVSSGAPGRPEATRPAEGLCWSWGPGPVDPDPSAPAQSPGTTRQ